MTVFQVLSGNVDRLGGGAVANPQAIEWLKENPGVTVNHQTMKDAEIDE